MLDMYLEDASVNNAAKNVIRAGRLLGLAEPELSTLIDDHFATYETECPTNTAFLRDFNLDIWFSDSIIDIGRGSPERLNLLKRRFQAGFREAIAGTNQFNKFINLLNRFQDELLEIDIILQPGAPVPVAETITGFDAAAETTFPNVHTNPDDFHATRPTETSVISELSEEDDEETIDVSDNEIDTIYAESETDESDNDLEPYSVDDYLEDAFVDDAIKTIIRAGRLLGLEDELLLVLVSDHFETFSSKYPERVKFLRDYDVNEWFAGAIANLQRNRPDTLHLLRTNFQGKFIDLNFGVPLNRVFDILHRPCFDSQVYGIEFRLSPPAAPTQPPKKRNKKKVYSVSEGSHSEDRTSDESTSEASAASAEPSSDKPAKRSKKSHKAKKEKTNRNIKIVLGAMLLTVLIVNPLFFSVSLLTTSLIAVGVGAMSFGLAEMFFSSSEQRDASQRVTTRNSERLGDLVGLRGKSFTQQYQNTNKTETKIAKTRTVQHKVKTKSAKI